MALRKSTSVIIIACVAGALGGGEGGFGTGEAKTGEAKTGEAKGKKRTRASLRARGKVSARKIQTSPLPNPPPPPNKAPAT